MLYVSRIIKVYQGVSTIDEPVILYNGDHNISVRFTILNQSFKFGNEFNMIDNENTQHAQLIVVSQTKEAVFTDVVPCSDDAVEFEIPQELLRVGKYSFQIRLYDYSKNSRITIPQVKDGIIVREPLVVEMGNQ